MKHRCSPYIDGSPITDYDFDIPSPLLENLIMEYKTSPDKNEVAKKILDMINGEEGDALEN